MALKARPLPQQTAGYGCAFLDLPHRQRQSRFVQSDFMMKPPLLRNPTPPRWPAKSPWFCPSTAVGHRRPALRCHPKSRWVFDRLQRRCAAPGIARQLPACDGRRQRRPRPHARRRLACLPAVGLATEFRHGRLHHLHSAVDGETAAALRCALPAGSDLLQEPAKTEAKRQMLSAALPPPPRRKDAAPESAERPRAQPSVRHLQVTFT